MADIVFDDGGILLPFIFDTTAEERHRMSSIATEHDVERGVAITDHVRPERRVFTLDVIVSDTPIRASAGVSGAPSVEMIDVRRGTQRAPRVNGGAVTPGRLEQSTDTVGLTVFRSDSAATRVVDMWARLEAARVAALLAVVTTKIATYRDMVLTEALTTRTAADGTWLRATLTFSEVRQADLEIVDDPVPARARDRRRVNRGSQSTEVAPPAARLRSLAAAGLAYLTGGA